jgi:DNA ligase D-like protein (predicted ligase)
VPRPAKIKAGFIPPMLLLRTERLSEGEDWLYELKLDGYRAIAAKSAGRVHLWSRNENDFGVRYPGIAKALEKLPDETVVDGEIVALDDSGKPSFNALQNYGSSQATLVFYLFDVPVLAGRDLRGEALDVRKKLLGEEILPRLADSGAGDPIRPSPALPGNLDDLIDAVKVQGFEGLVAKRRDSRYEAGERSGAWAKMRVNEGQEFVIGGYTIGGRTFDALVFGYYYGPQLMYAARTRNGFTPPLRESPMRRFRGMETANCPFANLPEARSGRWGQGLTAAKMKACRWLKPVLVGQFEFREWTPDHHLRHSRFVALRDDKEACEVGREVKEKV